MVPVLSCLSNEGQKGYQINRPKHSGLRTDENAWNVLGGSSNTAYTITGFCYISLMVDYFSRFLWAKVYTKHTAIEFVEMFEIHVSPIFGHPNAVYSDNGSHFVNAVVKNYFLGRGITHNMGPMSHLSSTGLLERASRGLQVSFEHNVLPDRQPKGGLYYWETEYFLPIQKA